MRKIKFASFIVFISILFLIPFNAQTLGRNPTGEALGNPTGEAEDNFICVSYFTGIGCPHCANTDPVILKDSLKQNPNLTVIEYEIYQQSENASINYQISDSYGFSLGIPKIVFGQNKQLIGDSPIIDNFESEISGLTENECFLADGTTTSFNDLMLNALPGKPKIWYQDRILIKIGSGEEEEILKKLLVGKPDELLKENNLKEVKPVNVALSGDEVIFDRAIELNGWIFQWRTDENGDILNNGDLIGPNEPSRPGNEDYRPQLTLTKILSLAAVDAVNPCALAVLILMLVSILSYNPGEKKKVLLSGLIFTLSVFIMYFFYGLVIVRFFQIIQALTNIRLWLYNLLGVLAVILGTLNIRDFVKYRPGRLGTEMPMFLRPKVSRIISRVTSPSGAFLTGLFVTVFLLPCTIGPYVICGGILCTLDLIKTIPWLMVYNLVFVLPMLIITGIVYFGISKVQDVSSWKDKNIRYLHLISGLIILLLGLAMVLGWV